MLPFLLAVPFLMSAADYGFRSMALDESRGDDADTDSSSSISPSAVSSTVPLRPPSLISSDNQSSLLFGDVAPEVSEYQGIRIREL